MTQARNNFERQDTLLKQGWTTRANHDHATQARQTAQSQVDAAEAQLKTAHDLVGFTELKADAPGVVTATGARAGEVVQAGQMIIKLARKDGRDAVFDVPAQVIRSATSDPEIAVNLADAHGRAAVWPGDSRPLRADDDLAEVVVCWASGGRSEFIVVDDVNDRLLARLLRQQLPGADLCRLNSWNCRDVPRIPLRSEDSQERTVLVLLPLAAARNVPSASVRHKLHKPLAAVVVGSASAKEIRKSGELKVSRPKAVAGHASFLFIQERRSWP